MIDLSRRLFLIGSAAAITAAVSSPVIRLQEVVKLPAQHVFLKRQIVGLSWQPFGLADQFQRLRLGRSNGQLPLLETAINAMGSYYWRPMPGGEPLFHEGEVLKLDVSGPCERAEIALDCLDFIDDGPPVLLVEQHSYPSGSVQVNFMYFDNSREAREERARKPVTWGEEIDEAALDTLETIE